MDEATSVSQPAVGDTVRVVWIDHVGGPQGWHSPDDLPKVLHVVTYGVIVSRDEESIVISSSLGWDPEKQAIDPDEAIGDTTAIVTSCVREVIALPIGSHAEE